MGQVRMHVTVLAEVMVGLYVERGPAEVAMTAVRSLLQGVAGGSSGFGYNVVALVPLAAVEAPAALQPSARPIEESLRAEPMERGRV